ncbi:hypothetical protein D3C78_1205860 [compost metagenome]
MGHHRALRLARHFLGRRDAAAVIAHGRRQAGQRAGCAPGHQAAPAKAHDAHLATADGCRMGNGGLHFGHGAGRRQRFGRRLEGHAVAHVLRRIAQVHIGLHAREHGRCDGHVATRSEAVGHGLDVGVDAEDLLQYHDGTARRAFGNGHPGGCAEAIGRSQSHEISHAVSSLSGGWCSPAQSRRATGAVMSQQMRDQCAFSQETA